MNTFPSERVKEDVFPVAIAQTQDVAHHGHHGSGAAVRGATAVPVNTMRMSEITQEDLISQFTHNLKIDQLLSPSLKLFKKLYIWKSRMVKLKNKNRLLLLLLDLLSEKVV